MRYISTRGKAPPVLSFEEAMLTGLARDGGGSMFPSLFRP